MGKWLSMDDCPRDGTRVLIYRRRYKSFRYVVFIAYWHQPGNPKYEGYFMSEGGSGRINPLAWMPLPNGPSK